MANQKMNSQSLEFYSEMSEAILVLSEMLLFSFVRHECSQLDLIIRNFIARASTSLKSILALWEMGDHPNAWVINRTILDRLFHLHYLGKTKTYKDFDDWSFFQQHKDQNRLKSDNEFKEKAVGWEYELSQDQKDRIAKLSKKVPQWKRPKAEQIAKDMDMTFLYKYGYDYGSKFVHPMSDDGLYDFYLITGLEPLSEKPSQIAVVTNSILASIMILQEAINQSSFIWRALVFDCIDQIRIAINTGDKLYMESLGKIIFMHKQIGLNEPQSST
jgi:hypothetical protein